MILVEQTLAYEKISCKRGLIITKDDVINLTRGLLKNKGLYFRYTINDKIYNFVNNNKKDIKVLLCQFFSGEKICNSHSGLCQKTERFKKLSMSETVTDSPLIRCSYKISEGELIFNNFIFLEFNNDRIHAKAKLLFS